MPQIIPGEPSPTRLPPWFRRGVVFVLLAVAAFEVALWVFGSLRSFLGLVFLAWLASISIEPVVDLLVDRGVRRGWATGLVMLFLAASAAGFLVAFGTLLVDQVTQLVTAAPDLVGEVVHWINQSFGTKLVTTDIVSSLRLTPQRIQQLVQQFTPGVVGIVSTLIGIVFQMVTLLIFTYYMSAQGPQLRGTVSRWFPPSQQRVIRVVWETAVEKTGGYVLSRLLLATLSAMVTGFFLWLLGVPYWLPLAIWTGLVSQFIPTVGTYLAIALPAMVALANQPVDALWVVIFATVYQQIENYLFSPRITAFTVDIHPAVAIGAVIVGAELFGPMGALVSVPVVAAIQTLVETYGRRYELLPHEEGGVAPPEPPQAPDAPEEPPPEAA